jgi:multidrug resistance efflux pump
MVTAEELDDIVEAIYRARQECWKAAQEAPARPARKSDFSVTSQQYDLAYIVASLDAAQTNLEQAVAVLATTEIRAPF